MDMAFLRDRAIKGRAHPQRYSLLNAAVKHIVPLGAPLRISCNSVPLPPFCCEFNRTPRAGQLLAVADENGVITVIDTTAALGASSSSSSAGGGSSATVSISIELPDAHRCRWTAHNNAVFDLQWSVDDARLVTASGDLTVRLYDVATQKCLAICAGHGGSVKSVRFAPRDTNVFASAGRDGNVMVWDARVPAAPVVALRNLHSDSALHSRRKGGENAAITGVVYGPDAKTLVTAGARDGCVKVWDLRCVAQTQRGGSGSGSGCGSGSGSGSGGRTRLSARQERGARSTPRRDLRRERRDHLRATPVHSLLAGEFDSATPQHATAATPQHATSSTSSSSSSSSSSSRRSSSLSSNVSYYTSTSTSSSSSSGSASSPIPVVCIEQAARRQNTRCWGITSLDMSPAGDKILISYFNSTVSLIDFVVPERGAQTFVGHPQPRQQPTRNGAASAGTAAEAHRQLRGTRSGGGGDGFDSSSFYVRSRLGPEGKHIVSGSKDRRAYIWSVAESGALGGSSSSRSGGSRSAACSSSSSSSSNGGGGDDASLARSRRCRLTERRPEATLIGHTREVTHVAWCSTDFGRIATCSDDFTVRLWALQRSRVDADARQARAQRERRLAAVGAGGGGAHSAQKRGRPVPLLAASSRSVTPVTTRQQSLEPPAIRRRGMHNPGRGAGGRMPPAAGGAAAGAPAAPAPMVGAPAPARAAAAVLAAGAAVAPAQVAAVPPKAVSDQQQQQRTLESFWLKDASN